MKFWKNFTLFFSLAVLIIALRFIFRIPTEVLDQAIELANQNIANISLGASFLAGILMFFSPCTLPIFISLIGAGASNDSELKKNLKKRIVFFAAGFMLAFLVIGFSVSALGQFYRIYQNKIILISGLFMIFLGVAVIFKLRLAFLNVSIRNVNLPLSHFFLGLFFGVGINPCIGPILLSIFFMAANSPNFLYSALLLLVYAAGIFAPYLFFVSRFEKLNALQKISYSKINFAAGLIILILGFFYAFFGSAGLLQRDVFGVWPFIYYIQAQILASSLITGILTILLAILFLFKAFKFFYHR